MKNVRHEEPLNYKTIKMKVLPHQQGPVCWVKPGELISEGTIWHTSEEASVILHPEMKDDNNLLQRRLNRISL